MPDRRRLEQPRRELVEERLEGVVVVLVDEHDVDVGLLQRSRGADAGEPAAEDDDAATRTAACLLTATAFHRRTSMCKGDAVFSPG